MKRAHVPRRSPPRSGRACARPARPPRPGSRRRAGSRSGGSGDSGASRPCRDPGRGTRVRRVLVAHHEERHRSPPRLVANPCSRPSTGAPRKSPRHRPGAHEGERREWRSDARAIDDATADRGGARVAGRHCERLRSARGRIDDHIRRHLRSPQQHDAHERLARAAGRSHRRQRRAEECVGDRQPFDRRAGVEPEHRSDRDDDVRVDEQQLDSSTRIRPALREPAALLRALPARWCQQRPAHRQGDERPGSRPRPGRGPESSGERLLRAVGDGPGEHAHADARGCQDGDGDRLRHRVPESSAFSWGPRRPTPRSASPTGPTTSRPYSRLRVRRRLDSRSRCRPAPHPRRSLPEVRRSPSPMSSSTQPDRPRTSR